MRIRELTACLLVAALCESHAAHAETPAPATAPASAPLPLALSLGDSKLQAEAIVRAVELELKRPVTLSNAKPNAEAALGAGQTLSVVVHADHTVSVSYHAADGVTRTRAIGLPQDDARGPELIALLAGNLSRDEAAELLAGLAAHATGAAGASTTAPATPEAEPAKKEPVPVPSAPPAPKPPGAPRPAAPAPHSSAGLLTKPYPLFDLTLAHPIGLFPDSERYVVNAELGLVYSRVGELRGAGVNVMVLNTERDVHGFSYATFYNRSGGSISGVTSAALVSRYADLQGCALSGIANFGRDAQGCALAGIANRARDGRGIQVAGITNIAARFEGVQLSGITNLADEIAGAQIGVVNVAGNVEGLQLGVVNVAKHVDGTSLGLVSVAGNGRAEAVLWASTFMAMNLAAKFIVGSFYSQVGGGYAPGNQTYAYELGLGAHLPIKRFFLEPGVHYSEQRGAVQPLAHELSEHLHYRVAVGWDQTWVSPFVGAAVMQRFAHAADAPDSATVRVEGFGGVAFF